MTARPSLSPAATALPEGEPSEALLPLPLGEAAEQRDSFLPLPLGEVAERSEDGEGSARKALSVACGDSSPKDANQ